MITVETKRGHVDIPFALPGDVLVQGNGVVVQTEDGSVVVPLKEFEVVVANGQVMLVGKANPFLTKLVAAVVVVVVVAVLSFTRSCASRVGENIGNRIISPVTP
ncbi:MAG: hypothetical protein DDT30_01206 [Dehalococcoidia bacterium]|nr:hypothetical protein [Bacillota bacterium]